MKGMKKARLAAAAAVAVVAWAGTAPAATILGGIYTLHNHPDGALVPPPYGLRLDDLYDAGPGRDSYTFDFDHLDSISARLAYNDVAQTIHIYGTVIGGRDIGGGYAADQYYGLYTFDFTYAVGVSLVPTDDDIWVELQHPENVGTISTPLGDTIPLASYVGTKFPFGFRFGDDEDDLGYRGFPGISGWGWMSAGGDPGDSKDWLFTAEYLAIPEPATAAILFVGGLLIASRRRR